MYSSLVTIVFISLLQFLLLSKISALTLRESLQNKLKINRYQQCPLPFNTFEPDISYTYPWNMLDIVRGAYLGRHFNRLHTAEEAEYHVMYLRVVDGGSGASFTYSTFHQGGSSSYEFVIGKNVSQGDAAYLKVYPRWGMIEIGVLQSALHSSVKWKKTEFLGAATMFTPPYGYGVRRSLHDSGNDFLTFEVMCDMGCLTWNYGESIPPVCDMSDKPFLLAS